MAPRGCVLVEMSERHDGDDELRAARDRGRGRLRRRRLALAAVVLVAAVGAGAVFAALATDGDGTVATPSITAAPTSITPAPTSVPTTTWSPPADDPTQPSPAAVAADREFRVAPSELFDCGVHVRTSGWPTTTVGDPGRVDCIVEAAEAGTSAQFVSTARDFEGGMEGMIFRVLGPADILVIDYRVDPAGDVTSTERTCTALALPNYPIPECL